MLGDPTQIFTMQWDLMLVWKILERKSNFQVKGTRAREKWIINK